MRFLADECCDYAVVLALRAAGHDVLAVCDFQQRSVDSDLLNLAVSEKRILVTEDKDFGWLVYVAGMDSAGVILIRFPALAREGLPAAVLRYVGENAAQLAGAFAVLRPGIVKISRKS